LDIAYSFDCNRNCSVSLIFFENYEKMNNNKKNLDIPIIVKRPSLKLGLDSDVQIRKPMVNFPIVNPFAMWNDKLATEKESAFMQGYTRAIRISKRTFSDLRNSLSAPSENLLGEFTEQLKETLSLKECFVLGFIQGINRTND